MILLMKYLFVNLGLN